MRIERIASVTDFLEWLLDQAGHVAMTAGPIGLFALHPSWWTAGLAAAVILTIREWEDRRRKSLEKLFAEAQMSFWERHIDRIVDVGSGTVGSAIIVGWILHRIG